MAVIGPRQSGKTTLVKLVFPDKPYFSLENPDIRRFALEYSAALDPFLKQMALTTLLFVLSFGIRQLIYILVFQ